jgi:hypothetical protein
MSTQGRGARGGYPIRFPLPIGVVFMFVADGHSKTGHLKLLHGFEWHAGVIGRVDLDHKVNFCFEGDVNGTYVFTVPFNPTRQGLTYYFNAASTFCWHLTLLEATPTEMIVGPFERTDAVIHVVHTWGSKFIPFELVPLLLRKEYMARESFKLVYPLL